MQSKYREAAEWSRQLNELGRRAEALIVQSLNVPTEVYPMERLHDLVRELLDSGEDPREITDTTRDSIREWRTSE